MATRQVSLQQNAFQSPKKLQENNLQRLWVVCDNNNNMITIWLSKRCHFQNGVQDGHRCFIIALNGIFTLYIQGGPKKNGQPMWPKFYQMYWYHVLEQLSRSRYHNTSIWLGGSWLAAIFLNNGQITIMTMLHMVQVRNHTSRSKWLVSKVHVVFLFNTNASRHAQYPPPPHTHTHTHTHLHTHTHARAHTHTHTHTHTHIHKHTRQISNRLNYILRFLTSHKFLHIPRRPRAHTHTSMHSTH